MRRRNFSGTSQDSSNRYRLGWLIGLTACLVMSLTASPLHADIIGGAVTGGSAMDAGGTFIELTPPISNPLGPANSVGDDSFDLPNLYAFNEDQNILLGADLGVDIGSTLTSGTTVASHYIIFDPGPSQTIVGTVDFDSEVLAIITSTTLLAASDFLANTGVNYLNPSARGLEGADVATISGLQQVSVSFGASSPGDVIRVLTAFSPGGEEPPSKVPEPASLGLVLMGLLGVGALRRKSTV